MHPASLPATAAAAEGAASIPPPPTNMPLHCLGAWPGLAAPLRAPPLSAWQQLLVSNLLATPQLPLLAPQLPFGLASLPQLHVWRGLAGAAAATPLPPCPPLPHPPPPLLSVPRPPVAFAGPVAAPDPIIAASRCESASEGASRGPAAAAAAAAAVAVSSSSPSSDAPFVCSQCGKGFHRRLGLRNHVRRHTDEQPFACRHAGCGARFNDWSNRKRHERRHAGEEEKEDGGR